ncbi:MAG: hypothetical protein WBD40_20635 [Tepidisphaeraceae bacterium]
MSQFHDTGSASATIDEPGDEVVDSTLHSLLDVYSVHGYDQGYTRATRDVLAFYPLLIEQFLHRRSEVTPEVRRLIRDFGRFVEERVGRRLTDAGFVDGAGI